MVDFGEKEGAVTSIEHHTASYRAMLNTGHTTVVDEGVLSLQRLRATARYYLASRSLLMATNVCSWFDILSASAVFVHETQCIVRITKLSSEL